MFLQAAVRYVKSHRADVNSGFSLFGSVETEKIEGSLQILCKTVVPEFAEDRDWENRLVSSMNGFGRFEVNSREEGISAFLDYQKITSSTDETEVRFDKITLMTIHAAKGTEFPVVIVAGMENGTFPIIPRHRSLAEIEEERGLFYVGMTRAKEQLYLTSVSHCRGNRECSASRFIREIPADRIHRWSSPFGRR